MPVERALLPEIDVTDQQDGDIEHHFYEAEPVCTGIASQVLKNVRPRVEKDRLHVEQDEYHRHEVKFHRKRFPRITRRGDPTLIGLLFRFIGAPPPDERRNEDQSTSEKGSNQQVYQ